MPTSPRTTTTTTTTTAAAAAALAVLVLTACGAGSVSASAPTSEQTSDQAASPSDGPPAGASPTQLETQPAPVSLLDGTRQVDVQLSTGQWLVPTVEGGLGAVADPAESDVPSSWVVTPVGDGSPGRLFVTVATTDGEPSCLRVVDAETVALATCDPADPAQVMQVTALDSPDQVNVTTTLGSLVSTPDSRLAVASDPGEPSSVLTLADRGVSTRS